MRRKEGDSPGSCVPLRHQGAEAAAVSTLTHPHPLEIRFPSGLEQAK